MKRRYLTLICAAAAALSLAACSSGNDGQSTSAATTAAQQTVSSFTPADVTDAVLEQIPINSSFAQGKDNTSANFDTMDMDTVTDYSYVVCASGAYPDEIAVFKFDSEASASAGKDAVDARLQQQISVYETYTPDEFYKLEDAVITQSGEYVYYLVTSDNAAAEKIVKGFIN